MTLTAFRLANFKAFGTSQRIPLRPITLVFGANSAGKSSLIHALALAHHAVETGELDTQRTQIGGEAIDLGGFRQYVHRRERGRQVELAFEIDAAGLTGHVAEMFGGARSAVVEIAIGAPLTKGHASEEWEPSARMMREAVEARVERFELRVDGARILSMSARRAGTLQFDYLDHALPVFAARLHRAVNLAAEAYRPREDEAEYFASILDSLVPSIPVTSSGLFPRVGEVPEHWMGPAFLPGEVFMGTVTGTRQDLLFNAARLFLPGVAKELLNGLAAALEADVRRLCYLGPLRSYPPRHLAFAQHHDPNWFAGGGYAWDVVRTREDIRRHVNRWLGDAARLKSPYELVVRDLLPGVAISNELPSKIAKALHDLAGAMLAKLHREEQPDLVTLAAEVAEQLAELDPEDAGDTLPEIEALVAAATDSDALAERWAKELVEARSEVIQDLVLIDKRTGTPVSHRDVGIGVSQVLPVLVSAYAFRDQLVAIEQPEIHLHPALQAELGDVFLASALGEQKNTFLLETHSEHVILRILRRIRETTDGELPDGAPSVRPQDVAVLHVQRGAQGAEVVNIPVTEEGEFAQPWPEGFFPERAKELF